MNFYGFKMIESEACKERKQVRFPKSKKKRIRAKWSNREENFTYIPRAFQTKDGFYVHPSIAAKLRNGIKPVTSLSQIPETWKY